VTVLVDSNVPMYLVGADHPNNDSAQRRLDDLISTGERLVTDVEVLRAILHRYTASQRPDAIQPAFDAVLGVVDEVLPVDLAQVEDAKRLSASSPSTRTSTASPACHGSRESLRPPVGRTGHASDARG
jgi:predicted nucleic acid-binding protein